MPDEFEPFLDEVFLRKLENLKLLARKGIRGHDKGEHISWRSGGSLEFLDYRKYHIGDDFRYVDWNVYGRLDKLFIKLFRAEENQTVHILIDRSRSMGTGKPTKAMYAKKIAAAVSYICLANLDRVRVTAFTDRLKESMPPARSKQTYSKVLKFLVSLSAVGRTGINKSLSEYADLRIRPGTAIILSDVLDPNGFKKGLEALKYEKYKVALIQILNHEEILPTIKGNLLLRDVETGRSRTIDLNSELIESYQKKIEAYINSIRNFCLDNRIDYYLYDTSILLEKFLLDYLTKGLIFR